MGCPMPYHQLTNASTRKLTVEIPPWNIQELKRRNSSCVVFDAADNVKHTITTYHIGEVQNFRLYEEPEVDEQGQYISGYDHKAKMAYQVRKLLEGPCCYALYCEVRNAVKIGFTDDLSRGHPALLFIAHSNPHFS
jgi:hypothetical protein